jgi:hypothetical protein
MIKWFLSKWYKHSPTCNCGWTMKPHHNIHQLEWKCVWEKKCGWGTFQDSNGKLHWWK